MQIATPVATPKRKPKDKPIVPEGFPLYWHQRGYWFKKYMGMTMRYEADPDRSMERWAADRDAIDGKRDRAPQKRFFLRDAINLYLTRQKRRYEDGDLSAVQFAKCRSELEYHLPIAVATSTPLASFRALDAADRSASALFYRIKSKAMKRGVFAAHRHITLVRACLDYAAERKLMLTPDYVDDFDPPSQDRLDKERHKRDADHGDRAWSIGELRKIIAEAERVGRERNTAQGVKPPHNPHMLAQILLALFAGFGSDDCSALPERVVNLDTGVVKFSRVKNGRPRMSILPKQAIKAIRWSIEHRTASTGDATKALLFRTSVGTKCNAARNTSDAKGLLKSGRNDTIGKNFQRLLIRLGLERHRAGFKSLRAHCRTLLVGAGIDEDIVRVIMGRKFRYPVDDYYIRGELRAEMLKASKHLERSIFKKRTG